MGEHKGKIDLELAKSFENDEFDAFARTNGETSGRSAAGSRSRRAAFPNGTGLPSTPAEPSSPRSPTAPSPPRWRSGASGPLRV